MTLASSSTLRPVVTLQQSPQPRCYLAANSFEAVPDWRRQASITFSMVDELTGAFATFSPLDEVIKASD